MENEILRVEDVRIGFQEDSGRLFHKKDQKEVLKGVTFSMKEGEALGLVGESGCGKSTLARIIAGLTKPDGGRVTHFSARPQMVFQDPYSSLNPAKKVSWILKEALRLKGGVPAEEQKRQAALMLKRVGLEEAAAERYPRQLSGGQRQRVSIAAALMQAPQLLVADEPVSALDVTIQAQIIDLLLELRRQMGLSILFISHDMRIVYQMCDRVIIMQDGRIVESGDADSVFFTPKHPYTKTLLAAAGIQE